MKQQIILIKKLSFSLLFIISSTINILAQSKSPTVAKGLTLKDFDKVQIENINGQVEIVLGKKYAIRIIADEDTRELVHVTRVEDKLHVTLTKKNIDDKVKRKSVKIEIEMPEISKLYNKSNTDVIINNFVGRYIGIENDGNGDILLLGSIVDFIEIENKGNGNVLAKSINAKKAIVNKAGNGDIAVKCDNYFKVTMAGNGDIINYGNAKAVIEKVSGNGKVVYRRN